MAGGRPPDAVPTGVACIDEYHHVASRFEGLPGIFDNANVGPRMYELLEQAACDKARGKGVNFHTARCQLRQLRDAQQRSDVVLCPRVAPDSMTAAYIEHTMPGVSLATLASRSASVLTLTVSLPAPSRQEVRLIMWAPDDGVVAARVATLKRLGATAREEEEDIPLGHIPDPTVCLFCAKPAPEKTCGRCRLARYCGQACQRAHWIEHKKVCSRREGHTGAAVGAGGPSVTFMVGDAPRTEAEREAALRQLNMQGDAGSGRFVDMEDPASIPSDEDLKKMMAQMEALGIDVEQLMKDHM